MTQIPKILTTVIAAIIPKKRILAYVGAALLGLLALLGGVNSKELKDSVCASDAVVIEKPEDARAPAQDAAKEAVKQIEK